MIHRLMLDGLALPEAPRLGGDWTGLTLSAVQAARGMAEVAPRLREPERRALLLESLQTEGHVHCRILAARASR